MNSQVMADDRWIGHHGIGRFAREVLLRLGDYEPVPVRTDHLSPLDPIRLHKMLRRLRPAVYFSPGFNPPFRCPVPLVFCIHDLIHLRMDGESGFRRWLYYKCFVKSGVNRACRVLTVSEYSKREIVSLLGVEPEKVVVVGNGVGAAFTDTGESYQASRPYVLYVGNAKPHKNIPRLLEGYARSGIDKDIDIKLTVSSTDGFLNLVHRLGVIGKVAFLGALSDEQLGPLYRGAMCVACPSLLEGFGLPIVESMSCGTPVVASDRTSIPEVTGDAALLFDPENVEAIAQSLRRICEDVSLRSQMRERGLMRVKQFSWDRTAGLVRDVLAAACESSQQM